MLFVEDLEELVVLTRDTLASNAPETGGEAITATEGATGAAVAAEKLPTELTSEDAISSSGIGMDIPLNIHLNVATADSQPQTSTATTHGQPAVKKKSKPKTTKKEFEVPQHLVINATDTEKESKRKKRAIKELKRKHKEAVKEEESNQKQQSWLSFKKKKIKNDGSIFSTHADESKVGVVGGGRKKTTFGERTRHK